MTHLTKALSALFKPKRVDVHRKQREEAKALAAKHGIEIEKLRGGGFNVWPPHASITGRLSPVVIEDPFDGDHYCGDWPEVLEMVQTFAKLIARRSFGCDK